MASSLLPKSSVFAGRMLNPTALIPQTPSLSPSNDAREKREEMLLKQLTSINENILAIGNNIQTVSNALIAEERSETIRVRGEKRRRIRLAEKEAFGGAEKTLESAVVRAIKAPLNAITKTVTGPLEMLKRSLLLLFGGWLTDKLIKMFDEEGGSFNERFDKFGGEIIKGVTAAIGALTLLDGSFLRIAGILTKLAFRIGKFLVLSPFRLLRALFRLGPGKKNVPKVRPRGKTPKGRLGRFFGRVAAGVGGVLEYQGAREQGYNKQLAAFKSFLVTGGAYTAGALTAFGLAKAGLPSGGASLVLIPTLTTAAATGTGAAISSGFDQIFKDAQKGYQGETDLFDTQGNATDYRLGIYEGGRFEVKKKGFFGFGKTKILDSEAILSGQQKIEPNQLNAQLLEMAVRQQHILSMGAPDQKARQDYGIKVAETAFGKLDIRPEKFDEETGQIKAINPVAEQLREAVIASGLGPEYADAVATNYMEVVEGTPTAVNVGIPAVLPVIPTKNPLNPFNDLARSIYNTRM